MTSRGSVRRSRAILRASLQTLRRSPKLAWFPVVTGLLFLGLAVATAVLFGLGGQLAHHPVAELGPLWAWLAPAPLDGETERRALSIAGIVTYLGGHLIVVGSGVAMTHAALEALAGREWSVRSSFAVALERRGAIASYSAILAVVGHLLNSSGSKKSRDGKRRKRNKPGLLKRLAKVAWWAATYLVFPVLAREKRSGFGAIERSAKLFGQTWNEILVARLTLWWVWLPLVLAGIIPAGLCALLGLTHPALLAAAVGLPALAIILVALALHTLDGIYRAALYTYATEGVIPEFFDTEELHEIWVTRDESDQML